MTIYILQQVVKSVTTNLFVRLADPNNFLRKADKRFWQGYFFGQIVLFCGFLLVMSLLGVK